MFSFQGVFRYEFLMQIRRPSVWIGFLLTTPLLFAFRSATIDVGDKFRVDKGNFHYVFITLRPIDMLAIWATASMLFLVIVAGLVLADRLPRDRRSHVEELLTTLPAERSTLLTGKYFGTALATMLPMFLVFMTGVILIAAHYQDPRVLFLGILLFLAVHVPATLFVAAFTIACTTFIWPPLYQFLFVGYWLWNALNPTESIPTLSGTLISPGGNWVIKGIFGVNDLIDNGYAQHATPALAIANLLLLALLAIGAMIAGSRIERARALSR
jgi:ABC-2 type transport system permease protein